MPKKSSSVKYPDNKPSNVIILDTCPSSCDSKSSSGSPRSSSSSDDSYISSLNSSKSVSHHTKNTSKSCYPECRSHGSDRRISRTSRNDSDTSSTSHDNCGCGQYCQHYLQYGRADVYKDEISGFKALIVPLTNLISITTGKSDMIKFKMRRKNKIVTLQFEPFSGQIAANGISYIVVNQTVCNLPDVILEYPIRIIYNGQAITSFLQINPNSSEQIRIYLNISGNGSNVNIGDTIIVNGLAVTWITD